MEERGIEPKKQQIIKEIISREWEMFDKVQNIGGRASCQEDWRTFYIMRYSQHSAFSEEMLESYLGDLFQAAKENRNLITEKYAYMMEFSDPEYYRVNLQPNIPAVSREKDVLITAIITRTMEEYEIFSRQYPSFCRAGRPALENAGGDVSVRNYTIGELRTYSEETLKLYLRDMLVAAQEGKPLVFTIQETQAGFYGYQSLGQAEDAMSR